MLQPIQRSPLGRVLLPLAVLFFGACDRPEESHVDNIFGADHRVTAPHAAPYSAIGRLDVGCTGTLVGQRLVLTAAHCVIDNATGSVKANINFFRPDFRDGQAAEALSIDRLWAGTDKPEDNRLSDWAVLHLASSPQATYGKLGVATPAIASNLPFSTSLVGYSADLDTGKNPSVHQGCEIKEVVDGKFYHACDGAGGVSGGPLINLINGSWSIVGITVSEYRQGAAGSVHRDAYTREYANVAVPADRFAVAVGRLLESADVGLPVPVLDGVIERAAPGAQNPQPTVPHSAAEVLTLEELVANAEVLTHVTEDLNLATRELATFASSRGVAELTNASTAAVTASDALGNVTTQVILSRAGHDYAAQLFASYKAEKTAALWLDAYAIPNDSPAQQRYAALVRRVDWTLGQWEHYVFGNAR